MHDPALPPIVNTPEFAGAVLAKYASAPIEALTPQEYEVAAVNMAHGMLDYFKRAGIDDNTAADNILSLIAVGMGAAEGMRKAAAEEAPSWGKSIGQAAQTAGKVVGQIASPVTSFANKAVEATGKAFDGARLGFDNPKAIESAQGGNKLQAGVQLAMGDKESGLIDRGIGAVKGAFGAQTVDKGQLATAQQVAKDGVWGTATRMLGQAGQWIMDPNNVPKWAPYAIGGLGMFAGAKAMGAGTGTALAAGVGGALAAPHIAKGFDAWNRAQPNTATPPPAAAPAVDPAKTPPAGETVAEKNQNTTRGILDRSLNTRVV